MDLRGPLGQQVYCASPRRRLLAFTSVYYSYPAHDEQKSNVHRNSRAETGDDSVNARQGQPARNSKEVNRSYRLTYAGKEDQPEELLVYIGLRIREIPTLEAQLGRLLGV